MDRAPYEVLIEATVAEVTLDQDESLGVVLNFDDGAESTGSDRTIIESNNGLFVNLIHNQGDLTSSLKCCSG